MQTSKAFRAGHRIYEQSLTNAFKYLELAIRKRGKQVFRHVDWNSNYAVGIVKGAGCSYFRGWMPAKFDLRRYLEEYGKTSRIDEHTTGVFHLVTNYPECFSIQKLKALSLKVVDKRLHPVVNMYGDIIN